MAEATRPQGLGGWRGLERLFSAAFAEPVDLGRRAFWLGFAAITILAVALRFWRLGETALWMDEAVTLAFARLPLHVILFNSIDNHPTLSYVIQHLWMTVVPDTDYARVPFAAAGCLAVVAIMLLAKDRISRSAALASGLLFALSTGQIYYSQEARMYVYVVLGLTIAALGSLGLAEARRFSYRTSAALYVAGGAIAIYSQAIGLVAMGTIGLASLAAALLAADRWALARGWFAANVVLLIITLPWLVALPAAQATFPGLPVPVPPLDMHWHLRNMVGYPGLAGVGLLQLAADAALLLTTAIGAGAAWFAGRRALALVIVGLAVAYPLILTGLHLHSPILHNRIFPPAGIGVVLGAGYALVAIRRRWIGLLGAAVFASLGLASSTYELAHHNKVEDYNGALAFIDERGFTDAPILTCTYFASAAAWEARPGATIYAIRPGGVIDYPGPQFWRAVAMSITAFRQSSPREIDAYLGGGLLVDGGLAAAVQGRDRLAFIRAGCDGVTEYALTPRLEALGYRLEAEETIHGAAADVVILETPETIVSLYARTPAG